MAVYFRAIVLLPGLLLAVAQAAAQDSAVAPSTKGRVLTSTSKKTSENTAANVLTPSQWRRVDTAVNRALGWLATQQQADGSFFTLDSGQPAVTSLCMMAFIAHGHVPGKGQYGTLLEDATDYVLSCQKENGLLTKLGPNGTAINRHVNHEIGGCAAYNHAI